MHRSFTPQYVKHTSLHAACLRPGLTVQPKCEELVARGSRRVSASYTSLAKKPLASRNRSEVIVFGSVTPGSLPSPEDCQTMHQASAQRSAQTSRMALLRPHDGCDQGPTGLSELAGLPPCQVSGFQNVLSCTVRLLDFPRVTPAKGRLRVVKQPRGICWCCCSLAGTNMDVCASQHKLDDLYSMHMLRQWRAVMLNALPG